MSPTLRIVLVIVAAVTVIWILSKIRQNRMRQEDTLFWICFSILMVILAVFPQLMYSLSRALGIQTPANALFLFIIALLLEKLFSLSVAVSNLQSKLESLTIELALREKEGNDNKTTVPELHL